ncbi:MAG: SRPBCC family protein [Deltaproteobacteria bacterium]
MPVHFEYAVEILKPQATVFAVLDDVSRTPEWLSRCTKIEKLDPGPNAVGTKLRYDYLQGRKTGTMTGSIAAHAAPDHIAFRYNDKMFDVTIDFKLVAVAAGTKLTQHIDIVPTSLVGRLLQPLIRRVLPKQTVTDLEKLRALV